MARMFINGDYVDSSGDDSHQVRNPATGEMIDRVPRGTARDVARAAKAAQAAFDGWWQTPASRRGAILYAAVALLEGRVEELARLLTSEQGKPLREARLEIRRFIHTLEHSAGLAKNLRGDMSPRWTRSDSA